MMQVVCSIATWTSNLTHSHLKNFQKQATLLVMEHLAYVKTLPCPECSSLPSPPDPIETPENIPTFSYR